MGATLNELSDAEGVGQQKGELSDADVFGSPSQQQQQQPQQIPQAFIDRLRRGQELQDAVKQSGDSFDKRFNEAYGDPFEAAAARTRQSVAPGRRQESLVTRLPEMMTASLLYGATIGPILAAKRLGEKTMAGGDILDDESIADATAVAGLGMFAGTHFSRVGPGGVQRIGELPNAKDFQNAATVLAPSEGFTAFHGSPNEFGQFRGRADVTTDQGFAERCRQQRGEPTQFAKSRPSGFLYQVNVAAKQDDFLNLDRPLSAQSENVKGALEKAGIQIDDRSGADVWDALRDANGAEGVARAMREAGIIGTSREHGVY